MVSGESGGECGRVSPAIRTVRGAFRGDNRRCAVGQFCERTRREHKERDKGVQTRILGTGYGLGYTGQG